MPNSYKEEQLIYKNMRRAPAPDKEIKSPPNRKPKKWEIHLQTSMGWWLLHRSHSQEGCVKWIDKWMRTTLRKSSVESYKIISPEGQEYSYQQSKQRIEDDAGTT